MFNNYLKITWRNLLKNKTFSIINLVGLSVGIAAFLLIINYLRFEYSYDDMHKNGDRIFRVPMIVAEKDGKQQTFAFTYPALAPAMKKDFPEVEKAARFRRRGGVVSNGDQRIIENGGIFFVDRDMFDIFSFTFKLGDSKNVFKELNDAIITEETAIKYFGKNDPLGKSLKYANEDYIVKGVLEDIPVNSHIRFNILLNYDKYIQLTDGSANTSWGWSDFYTYVLLKPGTSPKTVEAKFPAFTEQYMGADMRKSGFVQTFVLQPLKDIHTRSAYDYEMAGNGELGYLKYLAFAALFILIIAWINYINLSTARSIDRAKEIGVRKVAGAGQFQLIRQFLAESLFLNLLAIMIGLILFYLALPLFSELVQKDMVSLQTTSWRFWLPALGIFIFGAFLAGFYPAFVLASFQPIDAIKSSIGFKSNQGGKTLLRKSLVVFQFVAAIILIAGAFGFYRQLRYMQHRDLGVDINQTLVINQTSNLDSSQIPAYAGFIQDMKQYAAINSVTASTSVPGAEVGGSSSFTLKNSTVSKRCRVLGIDKEFLPAYGLSLAGGRNFANETPIQDTAVIVNVLVNETAARIFGFIQPLDILSQEVSDGQAYYKVIGVVKDFHQESLEYAFDPIVFYLGQESDFGNFCLKFTTTDLPGLMAYVKQKWSSYFPQSPFSSFFLDERFSAQYNNAQLFASVLWVFTGIALLIACLGLLGLSIFTIAKRKKEISIRKVLGANVFQITSMITRDYLKLIWLAGIIALPISFILVNNWIKKYAFHIDLGWWFFIIPLALIVLVALTTVMVQSIKAGLANPIKNLRSE
ncbi:MAG: ABC transporter permease [Saprospiraceae bacterium]|nr:ABC transporter permease [Saprospiraceae bacterium]